jgi:hypothetical protein
MTISGPINYDMVIYVDEQPASTDGGTFTSGAWRRRVLNTTRYVRETGPNWVFRFSDQITLQPGSYYIKGSAPAFDVSRHITRLQNITDATTAINGTAEYCPPVDQHQNRSFIEGVVTISSAKVFELQHSCQTTRSPNGLGVSSTLATNTYAILKITKLK